MSNTSPAHEESPGPTVAAKRGRPLNNVLYLTSASVIGKLFSYVLFVYSTHILGKGNFGIYSAIIAFVGFFGLLTELGLNTLVVRDLSQDHRQAVRYISNVMGIRVGGGVVAVAAITALSFTPVLPPLLGSVRLLVFLYALSLVAGGISNTATSVFQYSERLIYSAVFGVIQPAILMVCSIIVLHTSGGLGGLVTVFTVVNTVMALAEFIVIYRLGILPFRFEFDLSWWPKLVRLALPFMLLALLGVLYNQADTLILTYVRGPISAQDSVGLYQAAYRYLNILVGFVVGNFNAATLPAFSRVTAESTGALIRLLSLTLRLMLIVSLPIALWGTFYAPQILAINGRDFGPASGMALSILIWAFPLFMAETGVYNALYAVHRQRNVTTFFVVTLIFNVVGNLLLIPHFSFLGSAILTVASEILNLGLALVAIRRYIGPLPMGDIVLRPLLVSTVLGLILAGLTAGGIGMWIGIPVTAAIYIVLLRFARVFGPQEHDILARLPFGRQLVRVIGATP